MIPKFRAFDKETSKIYGVGLLDYYHDAAWLDNVIEDECVTVATRKFSEVELMQSTGLKDKNGKEVFIGDIVKCTRGCHHEVYLEKEYGGTFIGGMPAIYLKGIKEGYAWTEAEEIIGNIYENKEILEEKE